MDLKVSSPNNLKELSEFLAFSNSKADQYVGYCGEKPLEIYNTLKDDFSDLDVGDSFAIIIDNDIIIAALGLDIDIEKRTAEVWGPFIHEDFIEQKGVVIDNLWNYLISKVSVSIKEFEFFVSKGNLVSIYLIEKLKAKKYGEHLLLKAYKNDEISLNLSNENIIEYNDEFKDSFCSLHQLAFPTTYYNSYDIIHRLNSDNKLYISLENNRVTGYVYFEADPESGEGSIEYIAVANNKRKKGIGTHLLKKAVINLFSYETITELRLCVKKDNMKAINLYLASGFFIDKNLTYYRLNPTEVTTAGAEAR